MQSILEIENLHVVEGLAGPGHWKMYCSLLVDEKYVNSVYEMIPMWTEECGKELT